MQDLFVAPMWTPAREDLLIELCGEIGDEDTSLVERAEERAERFDEYRENRASDAASVRAAVAQIADGIPLGQPILVGHHSEKHARPWKRISASRSATVSEAERFTRLWQRDGLTLEQAEAIANFDHVSYAKRQRVGHRALVDAT